MTTHEGRRSEICTGSRRTEVKVSFQSNSLAAKTIVSRVASLARRGQLTFLVEGQLFAQEEILSSRADLD
jgi:hypothetical protein